MTHLKRISTLALLIGFSGYAFAQSTLNDAATAFNDAAAALATNPKEAVSLFEKSLQIAEGLEDATDIKERAKAQIPNAYYEIGLASLKLKQNKQAIVDFEKSEEIAVKYNDEKTVSRSKNYLSKLYNAEGVSAYKIKKYDKALAMYDKSIAKDSTFAKAYLGKVFVYKDMNNDEMLTTTATKAVDVATAANDNDTKDKVTTLAKNYFYNNAIADKKATKYAKAKENVVKSIAYDDTFENAYYLLSTVANELSQSDEAIVAANKAIELNRGTAEEKAKYYFELARALQAKKDIDGACAAYKNAAYGTYVQVANYQIQQMNCK